MGTVRSWAPQAGWNSRSCVYDHNTRNLGYCGSELEAANEEIELVRRSARVFEVKMSFRSEKEELY